MPGTQASGRFWSRRMYTPTQRFVRGLAFCCYLFCGLYIPWLIYSVVLWFCDSVSCPAGAEADDQDLRPVREGEGAAKDIQARHHQQANQQGHQPNSQTSDWTGPTPRSALPSRPWIRIKTGLSRRRTSSGASPTSHRRRFCLVEFYLVLRLFCFCFVKQNSFLFSLVWFGFLWLVGFGLVSVLFCFVLFLFALLSSRTCRWTPASRSSTRTRTACSTSRSSRTSWARGSPCQIRWLSWFARHDQIDDVRLLQIIC